MIILERVVLSTESKTAAESIKNFLSAYIGNDLILKFNI